MLEFQAASSILIRWRVDARDRNRENLFHISLSEIPLEAANNDGIRLDLVTMLTLLQPGLQKFLIDLMSENSAAS